MGRALNIYTKIDIRTYIKIQKRELTKKLYIPRVLGGLIRI